ncbi:MAG TPA: pyridoxamine 5'-phosphate oxidase family protein [Candidatus Limnocylindrales bacterium]|nr:pyridoxamine 5'-phosphate oxidase family protein [Candidatus Limnocylindrales bacterium]
MTEHDRDQDLDPAAIARRIIDTNQYMVIATANADGTPWISPVWFAHDGYRAFMWLSRPGRRHSRNLEAQAKVAITIFDSTQALGTGFGVTMEADAAVLDGDDLVRATEIASRRSASNGGGMLTVEMLRAGAALRLYRAVPTRLFVILGDDERVPIEL